MASPHDDVVKESPAKVAEQAADRRPSIREKLLERRLRLRSELSEVERCLTIIEEYPQAEELANSLLDRGIRGLGALY